MTVPYVDLLHTAHLATLQAENSPEKFHSVFFM